MSQVLVTTLNNIQEMYIQNHCGVQQPGSFRISSLACARISQITHPGNIIDLFDILDQIGSGLSKPS